MYPQNNMMTGSPTLQPVQPSMMIQGLPWRTPFVPNLQVSPRVQEYLRSATGFVLHEVQSKANSNPMRLLLYWTVAQGQFQNQTAFGMIAKVLDITEYMLAVYGQQYSADDIIKKAAEDVCKIMAVSLCQQHPSMLASLSPEGRADGERTLAYAGQLDAQLAMFRQQNQHNAIGGGFGLGAGTGQQGMQGGMQLAPGHVGRAIVSGGGFPAVHQHQQHHQNMIPATSYNNLFTNEDNSKKSGLMLAGAVINDDKKEMVITSASGVVTDLKSAVPAHMLAGVIAPAVNNEVKETTMSNAVVPTINGEFPSRPPAGEFKWGDRRFIHAKFAKFKPCLNIGLPYGTLYDPSKMVMFYEVTNPTAVREIAVEIEVFGGMQPYEDHETYHLLNQRILDKGIIPNRDEARKAFMEVVKAEDIAVMLKEREEKQASGADGLEAVIATKPFLIDEVNLKGRVNPVYRAVIETFVNLNNIDIPEDVVIGFHYEGAEDWVLKDQAAIAALELKTSRTWDVLKKRMEKLRSLAHSSYWNHVHDNITEAVNELVTRVMGIQARITHFVEDIDALRKHIGDKFGDATLDTFDAQAKQIASTAALFIEEEDESKGEGKQVEARYMVLEDVYLLPCNAEDLDWYHTGEAAVVTKKRMPELFAALESHFQRQADDQNSEFIRNTKFVTRDGKGVLFAKKGVYLTDSYLVYANR